MEYQDYGLVENPFRLTPPINPQDIIWVGMHKVKQQIEQRIKIAMTTSASRIVINWGSWGSGKTHAANYFTRTPRLNEISNDIRTSKAISVRVNLPRTSKDVVQAFWRALLGQMSFSSLVEDIQRLKQQLEQLEGFDAVISAIANDQVIKQLFIQLTEVEEKDFSDFENYLYGDTSKTTLRKLSLPLGISDDEQVVNLISTLFNCLTYKKMLYSAVILWIDEFEDIDTLNKSTGERFTTFLRQLIDKTPNNLLIFLNFTPKRFLNIEDLSVYLGDALLSRTGLRISFDEPTLDESVEYLVELLNHPYFRVNPSNSNSLYPFSLEVVTYVLENIGRRSIRKINEAFSIILELARLEGKSDITIEFVNQIKNEIIAWEN